VNTGIHQAANRFELPHAFLITSVSVKRILVGGSDKFIINFCAPDIAALTDAT